MFVYFYIVAVEPGENLEKKSLPLHYWFACGGAYIAETDKGYFAHNYEPFLNSKTECVAKTENIANAKNGSPKSSSMLPSLFIESVAT